MKAWWNKGARPIGLDIGLRMIKAAQCRADRGGSGRSLSAAAQVERAEPGKPLSEAEARRIADVLLRQGFSGRECVIAVPQSSVMQASMELPPRSSGAPLEQIAGGEIARANKCDPGTLRVGVWEVPTPTGPGGAKAECSTCMAVASRTSEIEATLDALASAGLDVAAVDVPSAALHRACEGLMGGEGALVDIGASGTLLAAVRGGAVVFQRHLSENGLGTLMSLMSEKLAVDDESAAALLSGGEGAEQTAALVQEFAEALSREVQLSLGYVQQRYPSLGAGSVIATGGGARVPGLLERLGDSLGAMVSKVEPEQLVRVEGMSESACTPALVQAIGLSLHPAGTGASA